MSESKKDHAEVLNRICKKLDVSAQMFINMLEDYNKRVFELNSETVNFTKKFIFPKGTLVNGMLEYDLNDDDKAILLGYKKRALETLNKEFPALYENWEDVKIFQNKDVDLNLYK
jgi:hypothetical protein